MSLETITNHAVEKLRLLAKFETTEYQLGRIVRDACDEAARCSATSIQADLDAAHAEIERCETLNNDLLDREAAWGIKVSELRGEIERLKEHGDGSWPTLGDDLPDVGR